MPFAKRIVEPQLLCRHAVPGDEGALFEDLRSVSNVALSRTLRQLSDLARHACSLFQDLESELAATSQRVWALQGKIGSIQQTLGGLDPKQEAVPVSNLDVESKLTSHYQAPWHQQRNVFHPSTRPPCLEELHRHAKQNLWALHRDQHQQQRASSHERHVTISISVAPPMPTYPSPRTLRHREQRNRHLRTTLQERPGKDVEYQQMQRKQRPVRESDLQPVQRKERPVRETEYQQMQRKFERKRSSSPIECCHFTPWSRKAPPPSDSDMDVVALGHRPRCPVPNVPSTLDKQTNWSRALPLPTPEERMKTESRVISSCIIPINVTGAGFDREASARCSLVHSQSVLQRRRKLRRRKTISGIPRRVQQDLDSDESPVARERTVIVHTNPDFSLRHEELALSSRLNTKDSGCQTEDLLFTAPSRRRIRAQRGQGIPNALSHSTGNITSLPDSADSMFTSVAGTRLRSRSLPREGGHLVDEGHDDSDDEELSPYEAEQFLPGPGERILKDEEESTDDQAVPEHQLVNLKQCTGSPDHTWTERGRSRFPRKIDMGSCEISSSSDTFSSPIHSVSTTGVLGSQIDHKEDHQSSSGNWSGSSSTCPSQTSETIPPAASPPLTGSSHCDSELSLNTALHATDDSTGFSIDPYQTDIPRVQAHQADSFTSGATNLMDPNIETANDSEWNFLHHQHDKSCHQDFSPPHPREDEGGLGCPSCTSVATYESFTDKLPSEKTDSSSHYSIDTEGYYTSMHFDCGLKGSRSYIHDYAALGSECGQSINVATSMGGYHQPDYHGTRTLGRHCLSLKKPKVKPAPPKRSSSLKKTVPDNEPKINSGQHLQLSSREIKLQLDLASSSCQLENTPFSEEPVESWAAKNVVEMTDSALFSPTDTHSFKGEGAVQSDYADLWLLNDLKSNDPYRSLSNSSTATGTTVIECIKSPESSESHTSQSGSRATTPSLPTVESEFKLASPEKLAGLASPSSGYSSQSETPTSSFPSAFFPGPLSPTSGKRKPKVPERKSSLSSLQQQQLSRDGGNSKRDLELPIIPPTHLDLSALHTVLTKPSAHRNQIHILHQNKQKAATVAKLEASGSVPMAITPSVLRSVHLRSIGRPSEGGQEQYGSDARPKCPTVPIVSTPSSSRSPESKKFGVHKSHKPLSQECCETLFTQEDRPSARDVAYQECARERQERDGPSPFWAMTAFRTPSDPMCTQEDPPLRAHFPPEDPQLDSPANHPSRTAADSTFCPEDEEEHTGDISMNTVQTEQSLPPTPEQTAEAPLMVMKTGSPPVLHIIAKRSDVNPCDSPDKVPVNTYQSDSSQAYTISNTSSKEDKHEISGVLTRSASQESKEEETTPDTEDYFSKESTPSDSLVSPLYDEIKLEDDSVFMSPSKARTTEDLFAMIHRSKRKVLGRKDSGELNNRNRISTGSASSTTTTPVTSPSTPVAPGTPTSSQKPPGPIYRCAKKSTTSNEEFKLLLLKKGSRTDSSYRMSATEILKSPITPKSPGDPMAEGARHLEELLSPLQQSPAGAEHLPGPFPRANTEGFSPKTFATSASSRQGRSRIPPPANSSRYSMRSRLYTAPMQAISEGETENSDGSPHDDRSSQSST